MKSEKKFNICVFDFNRQKFVSYDILPMARVELDDLYSKAVKYLKTKRFEKEVLSNKIDREYLIFPRNIQELKDKLNREFMRRMWAKCEWEITLVDWPCSTKHKKISGYDQAKMNLDIITDILHEEYKSKIEKYSEKYKEIVKNIKETHKTK